MQNFYDKLFIIFLVNIILRINEINSLLSHQPLWSWECVQEKCIPFKASLTREKLQTLETCNMLCSAAIFWPVPTGEVTLTRAAVPISSNLFEIEIVLASTNIVRDHIRDAFQLFKQDLQNMEGQSQGSEIAHDVLVRFTVNDNGHLGMRLDTDESYHLSLELLNTSPMTLIAEILASSFCGARHALETLLQLIWFDIYTDTLLIIQEATISDKPTYGYRGLMIDTVRNYIPFTELLRTVDAMSASKLNTLHWHASDSQGFSIQLNSVPQLVRSDANYESNFYTYDQIKALVRRAKLRGIRILIEIDTPAHVSQAWNWDPDNYGNLVQCADSEPWTLYCEHPPCGQLNPLNTNVFEILQNIYSEIIQLTGVDDVFHLGGDDISETCWEKHTNGSSPTALWAQFARLALQRLEFVNEKLPNLTLFWSSHICKLLETDLKDLSYHLGLQIRNAKWAKNDNTGRLRTVISHADTWDLNSGHGAWHEDKSKTLFNSWQKFYEHRPWIRSGRDYIEGGEATLWSWTLSEGGLDARIWPRAAALAERLWSDRAEGATRAVHARLDMHRKRLVNRGVQCEPIWSYWCTQNPYTCS